MQPVMQIVVIIPKNIAIPIQILVDVVCCTCTDDLSENVMYLVSAVVIPWDFVFDELRKRKKNQVNNADLLH